jgi:hypothetical protein
MRKPIQRRDIGPAHVAPRGSNQVLAPAVEAAPPGPSFARDIAPMFAPFAAAMMWRFDLTNYEAVTANAQTIATRLAQAGNFMPPPPFPPLTGDQVNLFNSWMNNGCNP